jgi:hypothetical protein
MIYNIEDSHTILKDTYNKEEEVRELELTFIDWKQLRDIKTMLLTFLRVYRVCISNSTINSTFYINISYS